MHFTSEQLEMGADNFREDYIEHLEKTNSNLRDQLLRIKEFETCLLDRDLRNKQYESILDDVKNVCNSACEALDNFFESFTATVNSFKNVLIWKSEVLRIPEKLAHALNSDSNNDNHTLELSSNSKNYGSFNDYDQSKNGRKCGTAKVCPMIRGHVISTPRIHLNRLAENPALKRIRPLGKTLSPIIEQSPNQSPGKTPSPIFRDIKIPLQRLSMEYLKRRTETEKSFSTENAPKISFTRRKCPGFELRKRYISLGENDRFRMMRERRAELANASKHGEVADDGANINERTKNLTTEILGNGETRGENISQEIDPLEGPSWLLDKQPRSEGSDSGLSSMDCRFVNVKRPKFGGSDRIMSYEDKRDVLNINDNAQMGNFELDSCQAEVTRENSMPLDKQSYENISLNGDSWSECSASAIAHSQRPREFEKVNSSTGRVSSGNSSFRTNLERKSIHERPDSPILSGKKGRAVKSNRLSSGRKCPSMKPRTTPKNSSPFNCSVHVRDSLCDITVTNESPKSCNSEQDSIFIKNCKKKIRKSLSRVTSNDEYPMRAKRRAAEICMEKLKNVSEIVVKKYVKSEETHIKEKIPKSRKRKLKIEKTRPRKSRKESNRMSDN